MSNKFDQTEWNFAVEEIKNEGDRAAGIVAGSILETVVEAAITYRLLPMSNTHFDTLFGDRGPLGTFSAKIDMAFSLGLFGAVAKSDLHKIRAIRNQFAHKFARDFGHPKVAEICSTITEYSPDFNTDELVKEHFPDPHSTKIVMRWRFMLAVAHIHGGIVREGRIVRFPNKPTHLA
jgi:hypothetical protein